MRATDEHPGGFWHERHNVRSLFSMELLMADAVMVNTLDKVKKPPVSIGAAAGPMRLQLYVTDADSIAELAAYPEGRERDEYALAALRIGLLSLRHARGQVDAQTVRNEGERLLEGLQHVLAEYRSQVQDSVAGSLREYFDPHTGKLPERIERLIKQDGELEQVLRRQVGRENSELVTTLTAHIGENSRLMRLLNPTEAAGLVQVLERSIGDALQSERERILSEFSLDEPNSALKRLLGDIDTKSRELQGDLADKIGGVIDEFSLDKPDSALNRLINRVETAQRAITSEFSLDNEGSALSRMSKLLEEATGAIDGNLTLDNENSALSRLRRELMDVLAAHAKAAGEFQEQVKSTLAALNAKREESLRSTRHGEVFEDKVCAFVESFANRGNDIATRTGTTTGAIPKCKVGDCVVELGDDSAAAGARIAVEAKDDASYDLAKARAEIDKARQNRDASVGLFVFSKKTAPFNQEPLCRHADDVFVIWDADDQLTDCYLSAGLMLTKSLCVRQRQMKEGVKCDFSKVDAAIIKLTREAERLDSMRTWTETIKNNGNKLADEIRKMAEGMARFLEELHDSTEALKSSLDTA